MLDNGGCAESCENTIGSYRCTCNKAGYQMVPGKTSCEGQLTRYPLEDVFVKVIGKVFFAVLYF